MLLSTIAYYYSRLHTSGTRTYHHTHAHTHTLLLQVYDEQHYILFNSSCLFLPSTYVSVVLSLTTSDTQTRPSMEPDATIVSPENGRYCTDKMFAWCPVFTRPTGRRGPGHRHSKSMRSSLPLMIDEPDGDHRSALTQPRWPRRLVARQRLSRVRANAGARNGARNEHRGPPDDSRSRRRRRKDDAATEGGNMGVGGDCEAGSMASRTRPLSPVYDMYRMGGP